MASAVIYGGYTTQDVTSSFISNENYSLVQNESIIIEKYDHVATVRLIVTCNNPATVHPGTEVLDRLLPHPNSILHFTAGPYGAASSDKANIRASIFTGGDLCLRWGTAGVSYSIIMTYICQ